MAQLNRCKNKTTHGTLREQYRVGDPKDPYDSKFAAHTVRLLLNGKEALLNEKITVMLKGKDLEFIKNIRYGKGFKTATDFYEFVKRLDGYMQRFYDISKLPHGPDEIAINRLLTRIHANYVKNYYIKRLAC